MIHAVAVFVTVQTEIQSQMWGILQGAGLRASVFWAGWWVPFIITALFNSLFGAIACATLEIHALQNIYFMGIFGSFFFLNVALIGASLFLAAVCGTARSGAATWCIILLVISAWVPYLVQISQSYWVHTAVDLEYEDSTPYGLFWVNRDTFVPGSPRVDGNTTAGGCELPIISKARNGVFLTADEQAASFPEDEFFVGCYFGSGYVNSAWNQDRHVGMAILFMFPYVHFSSIWGNFLGYTAMPDRKFEASQASMTPEELAVASLPESNSTTGYDSVLFPQRSTLNTDVDFDYDFGNWNAPSKTNCPSPSLKDYFCANFPSSRCMAAVESSPTESPSVNALFGYLLALALLYTGAAAYWSQVFPGKVSADGRITLRFCGILTLKPLYPVVEEWVSETILLFLATRVLVRLAQDQRIFRGPSGWNSGTRCPQILWKYRGVKRRYLDLGEWRSHRAVRPQWCWKGKLSPLVCVAASATPLFLTPILLTTYRPRYPTS